MAEKPGFFSYEGFPYPLLALGQAIPRGYQYQSQLTPYKRDAKGDWGRALNESIDQFFTMWPQYMQQRRQFALQRDQLARQRAADQHQAKLRPYELKQAEATQQLSERRMQMLKNYPQMVENLPVPEKYKAYLKGLPPTEGLKMMQTIMTTMMKPRTKVLQPGEEGNDFKVPINVGPGGKVTPINVPQELITVQPGGNFPDGTTNEGQTPIQYNTVTKKRIAYAGTAPPKKIEPATVDHPQVAALSKQFGVEYVQKMLPFLTVDKTYSETGELKFGEGVDTLNKELQEKSIASQTPSPSQLFQTKHAGNNYAQVLSYADLAESAGKNIDSQRLFAVSVLPQGHPVRKRAQDELDLKNVKMGRNGVFISSAYKKEYGRGGKKPLTVSEPHSIPVNKGNSLDQIIADFKAKGITVDKTQVIAANKYFFPEGDENKMKTSAEVGGAEMLIPVGGGTLSESSINAAHRSRDPRHNVTVIPGVGSYTNFNNTTVTESIKLNNDLADMKKLQSNVDEVLELMKDPNAISLMKTGHPARGLIEGLRWRLINNVQTLRDFGVLSPSEIDTIAKSVPDPNSFFNIVAGKAGLKPERFVQGVLGALKAEGITKANQLRAFMERYGVQEIDFKIHRFNPYQGQGQGQDSQATSEVNTFR